MPRRCFIVLTLLTLLSVPDCESFVSLARRDDKHSLMSPSSSRKRIGMALADSGKQNPYINKADLYSGDDLQQLLNIHQTLLKSVPGFTGSSPVDRDQAMPSLHDLVVNAVAQNVDTTTRSEPPNLLQLFDSRLEPEELNRLIPRIRAIVSDVDGTLLTSRHTLHDKTSAAVEKAVECTLSPIHPLKYFIPATGKTRAGALRSLGPRIKALLEQTPGVFCQGLYCVDAGGRVIYEQKLESSAIPRAEALAKEWELTLLGYDGDLILAGNWSAPDYVNEVAVRYGEPTPQIVKTVLQDHYNGFHKMLFLHDDAQFLTKEVRPKLQELAVELECEVTQAVPTMLELLPKGCSKALGVRKLCEHLGIDLSKEVCSIGDAENDLGLLQQSAIGIAVGNAKQNVKDAAHIVIRATNDEGAAGTAIELFGLGKVLEVTSED
jgi:Cof subfamily protein (haloacid dehalogenase superfamily)